MSYFIRTASCISHWAHAITWLHITPLLDYYITYSHYAIDTPADSWFSLPLFHYYISFITAITISQRLHFHFIDYMIALSLFMHISSWSAISQLSFTLSKDSWEAIAKSEILHFSYT